MIIQFLISIFYLEKCCHIAEAIKLPISPSTITDIISFINLSNSDLNLFIGAIIGSLVTSLIWLLKRLYIVTNKNKETKWLNIIHKGSTGKTDFWHVETKDGIKLGHIAWHGSFRQYSFFPMVNTVYEKQCMRDIADFMEEEMKMRNTINDAYKKSLE